MKYLILILITFAAQNAFALSSDEMFNQRLMDRLGRLERDLNLMEEQFYRKGGGDSKQSGGEDSGGQPKLEVRISDMEEQMRLLNGKLEERDFRVRNIESKLDKVLQDIDFRLNAIERKASNNAAIDTQPQTPVQQDKPQQLVGKMEPATRESIAPLDAMGQYDKAFEYLRNADYEKAEISLRDFIAGNQQSDLISNAYYWLGETYFVRENYEKSAVNFLKGYQEKPQGNKAADNLLKLAMSLDKLNKKKEACTTFAKLAKEFPNADKDIKDKTAAERKRIECF